MESRFGALLCGLVLVAHVMWVDCAPYFSKNMEEDIKMLDKTFNHTNLKGKQKNNFFKKQLEDMEQDYKKEEQKVLVLEMLSVYYNIFDKLSKEGDEQGRRSAQNLLSHLQEVRNHTALVRSHKLLNMQCAIRDHKWSNESRLLEAINNFKLVFNKASDLQVFRSQI